MVNESIYKFFETVLLGLGCVIVIIVYLGIFWGATQEGLPSDAPLKRKLFRVLIAHLVPLVVIAMGYAVKLLL